LRFSISGKSEREKDTGGICRAQWRRHRVQAFCARRRRFEFLALWIEGAENIAPEGLDALVSPERGVYRPGDEIHIGLVVKQRTGAGNLKGYHIETEVVDAPICGSDEEAHVARTGFTELSYQTAMNRATRPLHGHVT